MSWQGTRVVVTGGGGFLGSHLCDALVSRGACVTAIDDFSYGSPAHLKTVSAGVNVVRCRLGEQAESLKEALEADVLFHLAAVADPRRCKADFESAFRSNVLGLKACLESAGRLRRLIFMSSASVYGEPEYVPIDERHPLKGKDPYSVTKAIGEWLCRHYRENAGLPITIVRNFNTFGPRQSGAYLIPTLIGQALSRGKIEMWNAAPVRDFTFVSDAVAALMLLAEADGAEGLTVNLGQGAGIRVGELAAGIAALFGVPLVDLRQEVIGSPELVCDNARLKAVTGWAPRVSLEEGLRATIEYFRERNGTGLEPARQP
ncbi:MAG: NAD-dependent epimerase/dehydratase family protein [Nitrospirae bacterium]|nr:MAG: NAD-dependent epimerase/dehydratase family protein [Nitrospirota bacterium]